MGSGAQHPALLLLVCIGYRVGILLLVIVVLRDSLVLQRSRTLFAPEKKDHDEGFTQGTRRECLKQKECLFIVSPGLSGSTALLDAVNQFPRIFLRGENGAMMGHVWNLFTTYERFAAHYLDDSIESEMIKYERYVHDGKKPAWYNEFNYDKMKCLPYDIFRSIYGYSEFQDYMVGFKETRFWEVDRLLKPRESGDWAEYRCDQLDPNKYDDFVRNLMFHDSLCENTKFLFNHRRTYNYSTGTGFYVGPRRGELLKRRLQWAEQFASEHSNTSMVVYYEDMFDPKINSTVMSRLAGFLGRSMPADITFARLPKV